MIHPKCIIPECHVDTFFMEIMKELKAYTCNHQHSKGEVIKTLEKIDVPKALGIIDADPHAKFKADLSKYGYQQLKDDGEAGFLKLYRHSNGKYFLIEINKEFEYWLFYKLIPESGINVSQYGLPENWKDFCEYFKGEAVRKDEKIKSLFKALKSEVKSDSLKTYMSWVEECTK